MSRVGKQPVIVPTGVKSTIAGGDVMIEGPRGKLKYTCACGVDVTLVDGKIIVSIKGTDNQSRANYGTTRATINNMVKGVTEGWKRSLELNGIGFNAKVEKNSLVLSVGFSHEVNLPLPSGVKCNINKNIIELEGCDKEVLGTYAARVRKVSPAEPYLGKGIKYTNETIRRKAGKTGKKT